MSAPPMAATMWKPMTQAMRVIHSSGCHAVGLSAVTNPIDRYTHAATISRFSRCRPGKVSGLPETLPRNFRNASTEPVNVIAPMKTAR